MSTIDHRRGERRAETARELRRVFLSAKLELFGYESLDGAIEIFVAQLIVRMWNILGRTGPTVAGEDDDVEALLRLRSPEATLAAILALEVLRSPPPVMAEIRTIAFVFVL